MPGRPGSERRRRTAVATLRVTPDEKADIARRAAAAGETVSEFCRKAALGVPILSAVDRGAIADVNRLGGLLKWGLSGGEGAAPRAFEGETVPEARALLRRIGDAIERLAR